MNQLLKDKDIHQTKNNMGQDILLFDPYNPLNKEITTEEIKTILEKYGINAPIHNVALYQRAFIHQSYTRRSKLENMKHIVIAEKPDDCLPLKSKDNERLEFIGDGVLECVTKYSLYRRFPREEPGFMTEKKIALVKNESIGKMAFEMGLHKWVILSKHTESKQIRTNLKKLGCLFEAFIGAIFLDFNHIDIVDEENWFKDIFHCGPGFQMAQVFIEKVFETHVDWTELIRNDDNYKNILQVIIQKEFKTTPYYMHQIGNETNIERDDRFHMGVYLALGNNIIKDQYSSLPISQFNSFDEIHQYLHQHSNIFVFLGSGKHKIKTHAEQLACKNAIELLQNFK